MTTQRNVVRRLALLWLGVTVLLIAWIAPALAQQIFGAISGTVQDATGAAVQEVTVKARNVATNLTTTVHSQSSGFYSISNLSTGTYEVTFTKEGFATESHAEVLVNGDRTTTVDASLRVGAVATKVDVVGTPLMNQVDTTTGYVSPYCSGRPPGFRRKLTPNLTWEQRAGFTPAVSAR